MSVAGKVVLVTGASRGIGRGIALSLVKEGAHVIITGRHRKKAARADGLPGGLDTVVDELNAVARAGGTCRALVCDHGDDAAVEGVFDNIFAMEGKLDVLVNNAFSGVDSLGGDLRGQFFDKPLSHWDSFHHVGLRSHYTATVLASRRWVQKGHQALIVNIGSAAGATYVFDVAYGVGKAAVDRLTADSAHELKQHGITVVSVWPGAVRTEIVEKNLAAGVAEQAEAFTDLESVEMCGRGVVALTGDRGVMRWTGKVLLTPELGEEYGFTDTDGQIHWGADNFMRLMRKMMQRPPSQWRLPRKKGEGEAKTSAPISAKL